MTVSAGIVGHLKELEILKKTAATGAPAHAYLFTGPEGIGKFTTALWFARLINCRGAAPPCGECNSCRKIARSVHPDVRVIEGCSEADSEEEEDGENTVKIEQIRQIGNEINYKPLEAKYKFYIIPRAEKMTDGAANSFLKILEEPPSHAVIILITYNKLALLPTIISRCQHINFQPLKRSEILKFLENKAGLKDEQKAHLVASLSDGKPGRAVQLLENEDLWELRKKALDICERISGASYVNAIFLAQEMEKTRGNITRLLEFMLEWFRDLMVLKEGAKKDFIINLDRLDSLENSSYNLTVWQIESCIKHILEARAQLEMNANLKLVLQNLMLKLSEEV